MNRYLRSILVLLLLQGVAWLTYRHLLSAPITSLDDVAVLADAQRQGALFGEMWRHVGTYFSQPLLQLVFLLEYRLFGLDPAGYYAVNIVLHGLNAMLVYLLANMLFAGQRIALPAALLFLLGVGHYSKPLMTIAGTESLLLTLFYLVVLFGLIRDDLHHGGRLTSRWFALALAVYLLAGLTRPASLAILLCLVAYKLFFYHTRGRRAVWSANLWVLLLVGVGFSVAQQLWGYHEPLVRFRHPEGTVGVTLGSVKNIFRYLNLMVFPLQTSELLTASGRLVRWFYEARHVIRALVSLAIVSFSFFGFVFGNRPLRFFIAWTYLTVVPFAALSHPGDWLNIQYLYMAAVGLDVVIAVGTVGAVSLLARHPRKRWVPALAPLVLVAMSLSVHFRLHARNLRRAHQPHVREAVQLLQAAAPASLPGRRP